MMKYRQYFYQQNASTKIRIKKLLIIHYSLKTL